MCCVYYYCYCCFFFSSYYSFLFLPLSLSLSVFRIYSSIRILISHTETHSIVRRFTQTQPIYLFIIFVILPYFIFSRWMACCALRVRTHIDEELCAQQIHAKLLVIHNRCDENDGYCNAFSLRQPYDMCVLWFACNFINQFLFSFFYSSIVHRGIVHLHVCIVVHAPMYFRVLCKIC